MVVQPPRSAVDHADPPVGVGLADGGARGPHDHGDRPYERVADPSGRRTALTADRVAAK